MNWVEWVIWTLAISINATLVILWGTAALNDFRAGVRLRAREARFLRWMDWASTAVSSVLYCPTHGAQLVLTDCPKQCEAVAHRYLAELVQIRELNITDSLLDKEPPRYHWDFLHGGYRLCVAPLPCWCNYCERGIEKNWGRAKRWSLHGILRILTRIP